MLSVTYTSVATVDRIPTPSTHKFNACYIAQAEERTEITEQEESYVEELCDLIQHYRHEYSRLTNEIRRSRTRFNAIAYISRLPEELLATIFETYVADHWERYYPLNNPAMRLTAYQVTPYQWIKGVLHVCGQWRRVALSTPQLWTYIAYDKLYEDWRLDFLLEHAGDLPLTLRKDGHLIEDPHRPKDVDPEYLCDWTPSGPKFCWRVLQESFARIETLALTTFNEICALADVEGNNEVEGGVDHKSNDDRNGKQISKSGMQHLLLDLSVCEQFLLRNVSMPDLKSLVLNKTTLPLVQRLSCSTLTRLDVAFKHNVLPHEILGLLKGLPALRQLDVRPIGSSTATDGYGAALHPTVHPTVTLSSLKSIRIGGTAFGAMQLLNQLSFPLDTSISLWRRTGSFSPSLLSSVMPTVLGHTASAPDSTLGLTERGRYAYASPHTITLWSDSGSYAYMKAYFWRKPTSARVSWVTGDSDPAILNSPQAFTPDSSWVQCDNARLLIACVAEAGSVMCQLAVLDVSKVLSLTLSEVWAPTHKAPHGLLGRLQVFPQLKTLRFADLLVSYPDLRDFLRGLIAPAETMSPTSSIPAGVNPDGSSLNHAGESTQDPSTRLLLPSLQTLILPGLSLQPDDLGQPGAIDGDGIFALLRHCAQLGYKLKLLKFAPIHYLSLKKSNMTSTTFQDAVLKTGIADVVRMTSWQ